MQYMPLSTYIQFDAKLSVEFMSMGENQLENQMPLKTTLKPYITFYLQEITYFGGIFKGQF